MPAAFCERTCWRSSTRECKGDLCSKIVTTGQPYYPIFTTGQPYYQNIGSGSPFFHFILYCSFVIIFRMRWTCMPAVFCERTCWRFVSLNSRLEGRCKATWTRNSNSYGARPVHLTITIIMWFRTSRLSMKKSLWADLHAGSLLREDLLEIRARYVPDQLQPGRSV